MTSAEDLDIIEWGPNAPFRIRLVPDIFHVRYAGTAADGRRFFLSDKLFDGDRQFVAVFLWRSDGEFDELRVDTVPRTERGPIGQLLRWDARPFVRARLAELRPIVREPISVAPFEETRDGVRFGFIERELDGQPDVYVSPGDFIAYYPPWDGLEYDT